MSLEYSRTKRLRFAGYSPPGSVYSRAAQRFKELIEAKSDRRIAVDVFWNVLDFGYTAEQLIEMVDNGLLGGCYMSTSYLADLSPHLALLDLPFLISTRAQALALLDGPTGRVIAEQIEAASSLKHLGYWENGFRHLTNALRPVRSPNDLAGLRIRVQPNALHQRAFRLLGAEPVLTDVSEMINALREGRADGQENPLDNIWTYGVYRYTRYVTLSSHLYGVRGMYLNRDWFAGLPDPLQDLVVESGREVTLEQRAMAASREVEVRAQLEQHGLEITELLPEDIKAFRQLLHPLYEEAAETLGRDLLAELKTDQP